MSTWPSHTRQPTFPGAGSECDSQYCRTGMGPSMTVHMLRLPFAWTLLSLCDQMQHKTCTEGHDNP